MSRTTPDDFFVKKAKKNFQPFSQAREITPEAGKKSPLFLKFFQTGCNKEYVRWRLRRMVESLGFRALTFLLIILDVIIVTIDLINNPEKLQMNGYQIVDLIITVWFVAELILR